jgi:hypothetical protein
MIRLEGNYIWTYSQKLKHPNQGFNNLILHPLDELPDRYYEIINISFYRIQTGRKRGTLDPRTLKITTNKELSLLDIGDLLLTMEGADGMNCLEILSILRSLELSELGKIAKKSKKRHYAYRNLPERKMNLRELRRKAVDKTRFERNS